MRRIDDPDKWFLIDWEDAAVPPTTVPAHFNHRTHSPRVFTPGHGAEVDMWGVGRLITQCHGFDISAELQSLGKQMQETSPPTAQEALNVVKNYRSSRP